MKKLLVCILIVVLVLSCLTACDWLQRDVNDIFSDISEIAGAEKEEHENYTVFKFDEFKGKWTCKMERTELGEGAIYYHADLTDGSMIVKYDKGALYNDEPLVTLSAGETMPIQSSGGYVEGDKIYIIFETVTPVSGEVVISFVPFEEHVHTYQEYEI